VVDDVDQTGVLETIFDYPSADRFHVHLRIDVNPHYPAWVYHGFHLQNRAGRCVFRYDNVPHHPELNTFPHQEQVRMAEIAHEAHLSSPSEIIAGVARRRYS